MMVETAPLKPLVLASGSAIRRHILKSAGLGFEVDPPEVDEARIKTQMLARHAPPEVIAQSLADAKADIVARRHPDAVVLAADQILVFEGRLFDKPETRQDARARLLGMRGKTHLLVSGVTVRCGEEVERLSQISRLRMRAFSDAWLDAYMEAVPDSVLSSVGGYQFEGLGAQLFEQVDGDMFAILGLPLVPVLNMLRAKGALMS